MTETPDAAPTWVARHRSPDWTCDPAPPEVRDFHRSLPDYAPTPLVDLPGLAAELGVGRVLAKDESNRLGLPAFKALGASWAIHRVLAERPDPGPLTIVAATDGNHGRAVARFARRLGHRAAIVIPEGVHPTAIRAVADEGAVVTRIDGSYDEAVAAASRLADTPDAILVQDTAWPGYEEIPRWIVEGYATLFVELDDQLTDLGLEADLVLVPTGVGSLLQAALTHYRARSAALGTRVVAVEPVRAAGVTASLAAGRLTTVPTTPTAMAGLNCGTPSELAWPLIERGLDAAITVSEAADIGAAYDLAALGVAAGPCGAAPLAAVRSIAADPQRRAHVRLGPDSTVVLLVTEGDDSNPVPGRPE